MLLFGVALAFLVLFLALHAFVIPHLERMCRHDVENSLVRRAARLHVAYLARAMSATAMVVTGMVVLALVVVVLLPHDAATSAALIRRLAAVRLKLATVSPLSFAGIAVVTTLLLVLTVRATTRRKVAQLSERSLRDALEGLARDRASGVWIELPPTPDMLAVDQALRETIHLIERTEATPVLPVVKEARLAELHRRHGELVAARERLDVKRRLHDEVDLGRMVAPVVGGAVALVTPPWFRPGPLRDITAARRWTLTLVLAMAYLGTAGALVPALSSALDERLVAIDENAIGLAESRALARLLPEDNRPGGAVDERMARSLQTSVARAFEIAFGQFMVERLQTHSNRALVREGLILDFAAARRSEGTVRAVATLEEAAPGPERQAVEWVMDRAHEGEPITALGRRFAREGEALAKRYPAVRERIINHADNQLREADDKPPITALRVLMASQAVGEALAPERGDDKTPVSLVAAALREQIGVEALEPLYILKARQFNAVLAETSSIDTAAAWVAHLPLERMRHADYKPLVPTMVWLPNVDPALPPASLSPPAIREEPSPDVDEFRARGVLNALREQLGVRDDGLTAWRLTTPLTEYDDWFPAQSGSETRTVRGKLLGEWSATTLDPGLFSRARSVSRLPHSARGAGLMLGLPPLTGRADLDLKDLRWRPHLQLLELIAVDSQEQLIELGTFSRSTIAAALAFAADARPMALAVSAGGPLVGRRAVLHPALVDTPLGCRLHALVERLDTFARTTVVDEQSDHFAQLSAAYALAWAMRARHMDQVAWLDGNRPTHPDWVRSEAEMRLLDPDLSAAVGRALASPGTLARSDKSLYRTMPQYFEPWLVEIIEECAASPSRAEFDNCVASAVRRWVEGRAMGADVPWWHLPPDTDLALYASDAPFTLDPELKALRVPPEGDFSGLMGMLDLSVAASITTPASRAAGAADKARTDEDAAFGHATWPLPALGDRTTRALLRTIADSPQRRQLVESLVQFVVLQRLFRLAFEGRLGPRFPLERLVVLSRTISRSPVESVRTWRWYDEPGSLERSLARKLDAAQAALDRAAHTSARPPWVTEARRAFTTCAEEIGRRDAARENLSEVPDDVWSRLCLFDRPPVLGKGAWAPSEAIVRAIGRHAQGVRELRRLRRAIGVHKDDYRQADAGGCPPL